MQTVYLNGEFIPGTEAKISIFDRGLLFADSVYEGFAILDGQFIDLENHFARLQRSLSVLDMAPPITLDELYAILKKLIDIDQIDTGFSYLQITRGEQQRDFIYADNLIPNVFAFIQPQTNWLADSMPEAISMRSHADLRWARRDIKTTNLLAQVIAKNAAHRKGDLEALMIDKDGFVTEGGSTSFFIIKNSELLIRRLSHDILPGVTRKRMLTVAESVGLKVVERCYSLAEAIEADEAFHTAASFYIKPVGKIDNRQIGNGEAGPYTRKLREAYLKAVRSNFYTPG